MSFSFSWLRTRRTGGEKPQSRHSRTARLWVENLESRELLSAYVRGDVFLSVTGGKVNEYTPSGTLVQTLDDGTGATTTGSVFDSSANFYVTNFFTPGSVSKFGPTGSLLGTFGKSGFSADPESILFDGSGNACVGQADGNHQLLKFDSNGNLLATFSPATEDRGTDWDDLASDQKTMYYTSEGHHVKRFDVSTNTQLADLNSTAFTGNAAYELRILPDGTVLVADSESAIHLDTSGNIIKTYTPSGGVTGLFALNLDPDGKSFWTADFNTSEVYHFDIASGTLLGSFNSGTGADTVFGLSVFGQIQVATEADLALTKSASPNPVNVGSQLTYTLTVTNAGPDTATGTTLVDTLPGGVTFVSATASQGTVTQSNGTVTASLGSIAKAGSATLTILVTPTSADAGKTITNTATVTANESDPTPNDDTASVMTMVNGTTTGNITVTCIPISPIAGAPFSGAVASFTDSDGDAIGNFSASIDWGDGTTTTGSIAANNSGGFNVSGSHTYAVHGPLTLIVQVTDSDGTSGKGTCPLTVTTTGQFSTPSLNATINFWASTHGQSLIDSFNGGPSSTALATWLASSFPNLYGANGGSNNLTGKTNADVAALFLKFYAEARPKPDAQALALALNIYATTSSLGGSAGTAYGFTVTATGLGATFFNIGSNGAAFDAPNNVAILVYDMLVEANKHAVGGVLYSGNSALQQEFLNVVIALNDTGRNS